MRGVGQAEISPSDERLPRTRSPSPGGGASSNDVCSIFMPQSMGSWFHIGTQAVPEQVQQPVSMWIPGQSAPPSFPEGSLPAASAGLPYHTMIHQAVESYYTTTTVIAAVR